MADIPIMDWGEEFFVKRRGPFLKMSSLQFLTEISVVSTQELHISKAACFLNSGVCRRARLTLSILGFSPSGVSTDFGAVYNKDCGISGLTGAPTPQYVPHGSFVLTRGTPT